MAKKHFGGVTSCWMPKYGVMGLLGGRHGHWRMRSFAMSSATGTAGYQ